MRLFFSSAFGKGAVLVLALCFVSNPLLSKEALAQTFQAGVPEGFEELQRERQQLVDLYFQNSFLGSVLVSVSEGELRFEDPAEVVSLLPTLNDPLSLQSEITGKSFDQNLRLVCPTRGVVRDCGRLDPETLGVIYTPEQFRLDLFVNQSLFSRLSRVDDYLPAAQSQLSAISQFSVYRGGGDSGNSEFTFLENRSSIAFESWRVRSLANYLSNEGLKVDDALIEKDQDGYRFKAGLTRSAQNLVFGQRRLVGLGFETQNDTLMNRESEIGTPLSVYLRERGRVEVFLDDRLLDSMSFAAGNHALDTASFPSGSYELTLRITEGARPPRTEVRFFSKDREIPLMGRPNLDLFLGAERGPIADTPDAKTNLFARAGLGMRISDPLSVFGSLEYHRSSWFAQAGTAFVGAGLRVQADGLAGSDGTKAASLRFSTNSMKSLNFNLGARIVDPGDAFDLRATLPGTPRQFLIDDVVPPVGGFPSSGRTTLQLSGSASYSHRKFRVFALGNFRSRDNAHDYDIGIRATTDVYHSKGWWITANLDATESSAGGAVFAGISISFVGSRGGVQTTSGYRHRYGQGGNTSSGFSTSIQASAQSDFGGQLELAASSAVDLLPDGDNVQGNLEARTQFAQMSLDGIIVSEGVNTTRRYAIGGRTTLVGNSDGIRLTSDSSVVSAIQFRIKGARATDEFEVVVDDQPRLRLRGNGARFLSLPAYEHYKIRIRPVSTGPLLLPDPDRSITLLPGNAHSLTWAVSQQSAVFARLVNEAGLPVSISSVRMGREVSQTNEEGYFQIEGVSGATLSIVTNNGLELSASFPDFDTDSEFVELGDIVAYAR